MKPALAKRLGALASVLESAFGRREVALIAPEQTGVALDQSIERWRSGEELAGFPVGISSRRDAMLIVLEDLK